MSKSAAVFKDLPKAKVVIITGPNMPIPDEILKFKDNPEVIFIGDGTKRVNIKNIEKALEEYDKTDINFYLRAHGIRKDSVGPEGSRKKHYIILEQGKIKPTESFFREMHQAFGDALTVDTTACYGASANNVAKALGINSVLITHIPSKHASSIAHNDFEISKSIEDHLNNAPLVDRVRNTLLQSQPFTIVPVLNDAVGNTIKFKAPRIAKEDILKPLTQELADNTKNIEAIVSKLINKNIDDFKKGQNYDKVIDWVKERYSEQEADDLKNLKMNVSKEEAQGFLYGTINYLIANSNKANKQSILDLIDAYCDRNLSINKNERLPGTLLHKAIVAGDTEIVSKLLERGIDINALNNIGMTPLLSAIDKGDLDVVNLLIDRGADLNIPKKHGITPLLLALDKGYLKVVKSLIEKGADINKPKKDGTTPLLLAIDNGDLDTAKYLIDQGADVNIPKKGGITPLSLAIGCGYLNIVQNLLDKGADVNKAEKDGTTPLLLAIGINHLDIVKLLLEKGVDVNKANKDGVTALSAAVTSDNLGIAKILLEKGADPTIKDKQGRNALDYVKAGGSKEMALIFEQMPKKQLWQDKIGLLRPEENKQVNTDHRSRVLSQKQASVDKNLRRL